MTVRVTREDPKEVWFPNVLEDCVKCEKETRYWWHGGCFPLCPDCAKTVTRAWCITYARDNGYGPRPSS